MRAGRLVTALSLIALSVLGAPAAHSAPVAHSATLTAQLRGVNWADQRDNFVNGVLYPSGLGSADTYSSAATVASQVVGQLFSITGANTVRMPVNEPTVATFWGSYTGAIDAALAKGNVILTYWAYTGRQAAEHDRVLPDVGHDRRQVRGQPERLLRGHQRTLRIQRHATWTTSTTPG